MILEIKKIAKHVEARLNAISKAKGLDVLFEIAENTQEYESYMQKLNADNELSDYTPAIARTISPLVPSTQIGIYQGRYRISLYIKKEEYNDVEAVCNAYTEADTGSYSTIGDLMTYQSIGVLVPDQAPLFSQDGTNEDYISAMFEIVYSTTLNADVNIGADTKIKLDGTAVYFNSLNMRVDKSIINLPLSELNDQRMVTDQVVIAFPLLVAVEGDAYGSVKINELYSYGQNSTYNKQFELTITTAQHSKKANYVLRRFETTYDNTNTVIGFTCVFEIAHPRYPVTINGIGLKILHFAYTNNGSLTTATQPATLVNKSRRELSGKGFKLTIMHDFSVLSTQLLQECAGDMPVDETIYVLTQQIKGFDPIMYPEIAETLTQQQLEELSTITINSNVIINSFSIVSTENPALVYEVTFAEVNENV